ncbi:MAG: S-layer homology domain-containing protein [Candidatus Aminicenantes bacterium]|nr:S-layer homology domain-containing protein [Candidatus Aminicenantes bacterium]
MKWIIFPVAIMILVGCGGVNRINQNINIPDLSESEFYDSPYVEGWEKLKAGKPGTAMDKFEQSNVEDEKLYIAFGYTFLLRDKLKLSRQNFEKALVINPNNIQAELGIATIYEISEDRENAFRIYSHLRAKYPENAWIKVRYEYIRSTQTENYLKKAAEHRSHNRNDAYIRSLEQAARYSNDIIEIKLKIADFYFETEELEKATHYYEKIIEKLPNKEEVLVNLAQAYEKMEKYDSALIVYKRILDLKPGDTDLMKKINDIKVKFYDSNLPTKFKNIFFKYYLNREDLAALVGHYFNRFLNLKSTPMIITDISGSFARRHIIKLCTLDIMKVRPDHRFGRFEDVTRSAFAMVLFSLKKYLQTAGYSMNTTPVDEIIEPVDISPLHKHYSIIKYLVNAQIMKLDSENRFNPTEEVSPSEALVSIRKLLNSID